MFTLCLSSSTVTHTDTGPVLGVSTLVRVPRRVIEQVRSQKKKKEKMKKSMKVQF